MPKTTWTVYILQCADGSLYTGITNDMQRRLSAHEKGTASKYTRTRLPVRLGYSAPFASRSAASKEEARIKSLTREEKLRLLKTDRPLHRRS